MQRKSVQRELNVQYAHLRAEFCSFEEVWGSFAADK